MTVDSRIGQWCEDSDGDWGFVVGVSANNDLSALGGSDLDLLFWDAEVKAAPDIIPARAQPAVDAFAALALVPTLTAERDAARGEVERLKAQIAESMDEAINKDGGIYGRIENDILDTLGLDGTLDEAAEEVARLRDLAKAAEVLGEDPDPREVRARLAESAALVAEVSALTVCLRVAGVSQEIIDGIRREARGGAQ